MADIRHGDCLKLLGALPADSIDSLVTDPPYGLSFMGKGWDHGVPGVEFWTEAFRVAKPGAHLLAFGGTRTYHRLACAIEDAGWEIRDCVMWVYGSGFPKSHDVSKAIDKAAGAERKVVGNTGRNPHRLVKFKEQDGGRRAPTNEDITVPATDAARQWQGWGTALKPAWEPIIVARKPLDGTVAANVLAHGTGALNIDGCRVGAVDGENRARPPRTPNTILGNGKGTNLTASEHNSSSRWPANLIHDGSAEVVGLTGDAARFFYCPKASKADRDEGCEGIAERGNNRYGEWQGTADHAPKTKDHNKSRNHHPTVKPTTLMRYLCRLVTPPGGVVLDPFCGSGSTGKAAILEGFSFVGIEREAEYVEIAKARVASAIKERQPVGIGGQCVSGLPIGNGDSSDSVSSLRDSCDAGPECGTRSDLHGGQPSALLRAEAHFQQLELTFS